MSCDWAGKRTRISQKLWEQIEPLLPRYRRSSKGGRPRACLRGVVDGLWYILRTGCQWKELPAYYGSSSTVHRYFQEWVQRGIFKKLWKVCLKVYDRRRGIQWRWQSADGAMTKAPLGGGKNR